MVYFLYNFPNFLNDALRKDPLHDFLRSLFSRFFLLFLSTH